MEIIMVTKKMTDSGPFDPPRATEWSHIVVSIEGKLNLNVVIIFGTFSTLRHEFTCAFFAYAEVFYFLKGAFRCFVL